MAPAAISLKRRFYGPGRVLPPRPTLALLLAAVVAASLAAPRPGGPEPVRAPVAGTGMTPYEATVDPASRLQAAAIEVAGSLDTAEAVAETLRAMPAYRVNAVTMYGLEDWEPSGSTAKKDELCATLDRLGMQIVVRLEQYDGSSFAFRTVDVDWLVARYQPLLSYFANAGRRALVAYFAINMPLDDPAVQERLGGANSALSRTRQQQYAQLVVARLRTLLGSLGFGSAALRLGVFYGWDGGYDLPSYAAAQPDGYFLTSYSYPVGAPLDESAGDGELINEPGLRRVVDRFVGQYGGASFVVEYGFHTVEFNAWLTPAQTAGLVRTLAAKQRALRATTGFYGGFPGFAGTSYFGFDLVKHEGNATDLIDWTLLY